MNEYEDIRLFTRNDQEDDFEDKHKDKDRAVLERMRRGTLESGEDFEVIDVGSWRHYETWMLEDEARLAEAFGRRQIAAKAREYARAVHNWQSDRAAIPIPRDHIEPPF